MFATDWMTRPAEPPTTVVASHRVDAAARYLRLVFVARSDPANLVRSALLREFTEHALLPLGPSFLILLGANALMIRRGLRPLSAAAAWARAVRPGVAAPPLSTEGAAPEIADLTSATRRAMQRLSEALEGERRRAAEAAHALRTPVAVLTARLDGLSDSPTATSLGADIAALGRAQGVSTVNLRYSGERGVKFYTHVSDQFAPFATRAIATTAAEAPHVLDGLLRHGGRTHADQRASYRYRRLLGSRLRPVRAARPPLRAPHPRPALEAALCSRELTANARCRPSPKPSLPSVMTLVSDSPVSALRPDLFRSACRAASRGSASRWC